jgi:hypothetical protein
MDNYLWRGQQSFRQSEHIEPAPYTSLKTLKLFRGCAGVFLTLVSIIHIFVVGIKTFDYVTNWAMILTALTFDLLWLETYRETKKIKQLVRPLAGLQQASSFVHSEYSFDQSD